MKNIIVVILLSLLVAACGSTPKPTADLVPPTPIAGTGGKYISPFLANGQITQWAEKSWSEEVVKNVSGNVGGNVGSRIGGAIGGAWGSLVGAVTGRVAAREATREAFLSAIGGEEYIKANSDLSFNSLTDMAKFMYIKHSKNSQYAHVLDAVMQLYPDMEETYEKAIDSL